MTEGSKTSSSTESRVAVVTGGNGAIGGSIVRSLEAEGLRTVAIDRTGRFACDLSSEASTRQVAADVLAEYGGCDVFVHSAAAFDQVDLPHLDVESWRRIQATNVESALWLAQTFIPGMIERGFGRIIFVVSDTFWAPPGPEMLPYVASKGALIGTMRTLAVSLGRYGIAVSAVAPGLTDTPGSRTVNTDSDFDAVVDRQALKRRLTPEDTAAAVGYLTSNGGAAMTGQILCVDGGLLLR